MFKTVGTIINSKTNFFSSKKSGHIIFGIDPGLRNLGIGILEVKKEVEIETIKIINKKGIIKKETIPVEKLCETIISHAQILLQIKADRKIEQKLYFIYSNIKKLIEEFNPDLIIIEDAFVGVNKSSALKLGLSRGSILSAIGKFDKNLQIISPKEIKMQVTGKGDCEKDDIWSFFANNLPNWDKNMKMDSSDAVGAAFCGIKHFVKTL